MSFQDVALQHIQEMQRQTQNRFREYNPGIRCKTALTTVFFNGQQNINLNIILPINFPYTPPIISVHPIYKHEKIYSDGTIIDDTIKLWNFKSRLSMTVQLILNKLEAKNPNVLFRPQQMGNADQHLNPIPSNISQNQQANIKSHEPNRPLNPTLVDRHVNRIKEEKKNEQEPINSKLFINPHQQVQDSKMSKLKESLNNKEELLSEENIKGNLKLQLSGKSIEELLLISYNPEEYVNTLTENLRRENLESLKEVERIKGKSFYVDQNERLKEEYDKILETIKEHRARYEENEKTLSVLLTRKKEIEGRFGLPAFVEDLNRHIDSSYGRARQEIISDFLSKRIDFDTFIERFKPVSKDYHYYSMIRDKLRHMAKTELNN